MLTNIQFQNFKALADVSIDLEPMTVLVGPNACGKSSVLEGLEYLSRLGQEQPEERQWSLGRPDLAFGKQPHRLRTRSAADQDIRIAASGPGGAVSIQTNAHKDGLHRTYTTQLRDANGGVSELLFSGQSLTESQQLSASTLLRWLGDTRVLQLQAYWLAQPAYSEDEVPTVSRFGVGLAPTLAHLASTAPDTLQAIQADLRRVVPITGRLRMPRAEVERQQHEIVSFGDQKMNRPIRQVVWGNRLELEVDGEGFIPADQLSEGTLLVLGLLTIVHGPRAPSLLLIDDLERALHPSAQHELIVLLRRLLDEHPGIQIICTSHSPYLLDSFNGAEVRVLNLDASGHTICRPLTAHPDWSHMHEDFRAGEFWSTVSESWVRAS